MTDTDKPQGDQIDRWGRMTQENEKLRLVARDARELATGVLDMAVGCLAPEEMRDVAARIIRATS
jgi:hypothetical protein